jgi:hypothetical protein
MNMEMLYLVDRTIVWQKKQLKLLQVFLSLL